MDLPPAYAAEVGRLVVDEYGYERFMRAALDARWVKSARPDTGNALGQTSAFWFVLTEYAVAAGAAAMADSPAPGPGDLAGLGILAVGLVGAGFGDHELAAIPRRARDRVASATPAVPAAAATAAPSASAAPSATWTKKEPVMPLGLSVADQALWNTCNQQHKTYEATGREDGSYAKEMNRTLRLLLQKQASPQDQVDFCAAVDKRIKLTQREHKERSKYIQDDCDIFDWLNDGSTKAERLAAHQRELSHVDTELKNLYDFQNRFCK